MWAKSIRTREGIFTVGKRGTAHIFVNEDAMTADIYTAGGNIFTVRVKRILENAGGYCANSRKYFGREIH